MLEAIFLLGFGKSFLNRKKAEMVNDNSQEFIIHLDTDGPAGKNRITAHYNNRFSLFLDQKKSTIFEIKRYLYPVYFSSSDYNLYIENKPYTRKMVDRFVFGVDTLYLRYLLSYNKALKQKNFLLKTKRNINELKSWNKILSEMAEKLVGIKMSFIKQLNVEIEKKFGTQLKFLYKPSFNLEEGISHTVFLQQIEAMEEKEMILRRGMIGTHLDKYSMELNSKPLSLYSSGEKKIHLLMIYIAFIELYKNIHSRYPIFLVDDFDTAIDSHNIDFLVKNYPSMQVIATSVNLHDAFDNTIQLKKEN